MKLRCADHIRSFALEPRRCGDAWARALGRHGRDVVDAKTLAVVFDQGVSRRLIRGRLVSALLVLGALALVLLAVIGSMLENVAQKVNQNVDEAPRLAAARIRVLLGVVAPAAVVFLVVVLLYRYLPHHRPRRLAALYGGAAAAVAHQAVQAGLGWYPVWARRLHQGLWLCECGLRLPSSPST